MAWTGADVEAWMGVDTGTLNATLLARVVAAVTDHADRHYDLTTVAPTDEHDQALIMQAARLYNRKHSPAGWSGSDDLTPVQVQVFDPDIARMLAGRILTPGIFGPTATFPA
jgi:hypothetical protein